MLGSTQINSVTGQNPRLDWHHFVQEINLRLNSIREVRFEVWIKMIRINLDYAGMWVANQLERVSRLVGTVHSRLAQSPVINTWHDRFHTLSEELLRWELQQIGVAPDKIEALVKISVFTIEGLLAHPLPEEQKRAICAALLTL